MPLFFAVFLSIYALMHLMVWWGIRPLLPTGRALRCGLTAWAAAMIFTPVLVRVLERTGMTPVARAFAWIGYLWMGFLWIAFALFVAQALWNGSTCLLGRFWKPTAELSLRGQGIALFLFILTLCAGTYAFFEAQWLKTEHVTLESRLLPQDRPRLRIVQVSDIHLGLLNREEELSAIIGEILKLKPDILAATGDILDAGATHLEGLDIPWQAVQPPLGKFAVIGNHEVYSGLEQSVAFLEKAGFLVLDSRLVETGGIQVAGVSDPARGNGPEDLKALAGARKDRFTLFLKHRPWVTTGATGNFNLQLSGHAHLGQIFPFNLITGLVYPLQNGLYLLDNNSRLYTSRGTGCWGPPMRLFAPPEITVIDIVRQPSASR
jgi:predicted MPP superfamily phosphohydrolase